MDKHRQFKKLVPWFINGTLSESEQDAMNRHMKFCAECRDQVRSEIKTVQILCDPPQRLEQMAKQQEAIFEKLLLQINLSAAGSSTQPDKALALRKKKWRKKKWAWALAAAMLFGIAAPSFMLGRYSKEAPYVGMTTPPSHRGAVVQILFQETTSERERMQILLQSRGHLLSEPNTQRVYRLALPPGADVEKISRQLRLNPAVRWIGVEQQ